MKGFEEGEVFLKGSLQKICNEGFGF